MPGSRSIGVFTHGGHGYRAPGAGPGAAADEIAVLGAAADTLRDAGFAIERISAGSTPTGVHAAAGQVTEIRPGTYLLGDRQQFALGAIPADGIALVVAATVVSTAVGGQVVLDAGAKTLTKDRAPFLEGFGAIPAYPAATIERLFDYHAAVAIPDGSPAPRLGEVVAIVPNHVCPVVEQFDEFVVARDGVAEDRWPVDARGAEPMTGLTERVVIEPMTDADGPVVLGIYGEGIATGNATLDGRIPAWAEWDASHRRDCRLVARIDGHVAGWTALSNYSSREVYRGVAWESVYVGRGCARQGIGGALLRELIPLTEARGIWTLLAGILLENEASLRAPRAGGLPSDRRPGARRSGPDRPLARCRAAGAPERDVPAAG